MLTKEDRFKYLEKLSQSNEGEALREHFDELIKKLTDARNYKSEDFEMEGKSSIKAAALLKKIMTDLGLLKKTKPIKGKDTYN